MLKRWSEQDINILMNIYIIDQNIPGLRGSEQRIDAYRNVNSFVEPSWSLMKLATEEFDRISKALADPQRRAILQKLALTGKLNCSDVGVFFDVTQPTVYQRLNELATPHDVEKEKQGQFCYYHVNNAVLSAYVAELQRRLGLNA